MLKLEGDIGGGLILEREIYFTKDNPKVLKIDSGIIACQVGAGSGGFSRLTDKIHFHCQFLFSLLLNIVSSRFRLVCLRVHPTFNLLHPTESYISFTSIDGSKHEVWPESSERYFEGSLRPNGNLPVFF